MTIIEVLQKNPTYIRRKGWTNGFTIKVKDGELLIDGTIDPANGRKGGLSPESLMANDWYIPTTCSDLSTLPAGTKVKYADKLYVTINGKMYKDEPVEIGAAFVIVM